MAFLRSPFEWITTEQGGSIALAVMNRHIKYPTDVNYSKGLIDFIEFMLQVSFDVFYNLVNLIAHLVNLTLDLVDLTLDFN